MLIGSSKEFEENERAYNEPNEPDMTPIRQLNFFQSEYREIADTIAANLNCSILTTEQKQLYVSSD